jgi:hydroxypyruvate isomerase
MRIDDDTVRAAHAAREMLRLYDAYRASIRAQQIASRQLRRHLRAAPLRDAATQAMRISALEEREALDARTDAVYALRRAQVLRRLHELQDIPEPI